VPYTALPSRGASFELEERVTAFNRAVDLLEVHLLLWVVDKGFIDKDYIVVRWTLELLFCVV
jgi:hypothetical protein